MNAQTQRSEPIVKRVVLGSKPFYWYDADEVNGKKHKSAMPGETIVVRITTAAAFPDRIGDLKLFEAQKAAAQAQQDALDDLKATATEAGRINQKVPPTEKKSAIQTKSKE